MDSLYHKPAYIPDVDSVVALQDRYYFIHLNITWGPGMKSKEGGSHNNNKNK